MFRLNTVSLYDTVNILRVAHRIAGVIRSCFRKEAPPMTYSTGNIIADSCRLCLSFTEKLLTDIPRVVRSFRRLGVSRSPAIIRRSCWVT
ncbi:MAG: hypothetical protein R3B96_18180 [Pirellulaceae bacterium]